MCSRVSCREARFASFGGRSWHSTCVSLPAKISFFGNGRFVHVAETPCLSLSTSWHGTAQFGRPVPEMSMMTNVVIELIYREHSHHLTDFNQPFLSPASLRTYANAIHEKGAALNNCWGFIDGTVRPICRSLQNQRIVYNGHKREHALKFQSIATPNGLIANLYGPVGEWKNVFRIYSPRLGYQIPEG